MNKIIGIIALLCVSEVSFASPNREISLKYGVISDAGQIVAFPSTKLFILGARDDLGLFTQQLELGFISDPNPGQTSSAFTIYSVGLETKTEPFFAYYLLGGGLFTGTDNKLSSFFNFSHDMGIGFKDKRGVAVDLSYRHMSNAGLVPPNYGRNFIVLRLSLPWSYFFGA